MDFLIISKRQRLERSAAPLPFVATERNLPRNLISPGSAVSIPLTISTRSLAPECGRPIKDWMQLREGLDRVFLFREPYNPLNRYLQPAVPRTLWTVLPRVRAARSQSRGLSKNYRCIVLAIRFVRPVRRSAAEQPLRKSGPRRMAPLLIDCSDWEEFRRSSSTGGLGLDTAGTLSRFARYDRHRFILPRRPSSSSPDASPPGFAGSSRR